MRLHALEYDRNALSHADAHGAERIAPPAQDQLIHCSHRKARARCTQRMGQAR